MKLLHTADWHIGKKVNGYSLLEEQEHAFEQILAIAQEEQVDGIVIAGDIYDRALPPVEAVEKLSEMFRSMVEDLDIPIYAISGNHDDSRRLAFGTTLFEKSNLYLKTKLEDSFVPIETSEAQIFLLPFFEPIDARIYFDYEIEGNEHRQIGYALEKVVEEMKKRFNPEKKQVLVTHFAVRKGKENDEEVEKTFREQLTSETLSTVGGLRTVTTKLFEVFDAVLLGHIHTRFASPSEKVFYSGSPVVFNTKEAKRRETKGVFIVEVTEEGIRKTFRDIEPKTPFIVVEENFETLISPDYYKNYPVKEAWFSIVIKEFEPSKYQNINIRSRLKEIYGEDNIVELDTDYKTQTITRKMQREVSVQNASELDIIGEFYQLVSGEKLSDRQKEILEYVLNEIEKE